MAALGTSDFVLERYLSEATSPMAEQGLFPLGDNC